MRINLGLIVFFVGGMLIGFLILLVYYYVSFIKSKKKNINITNNFSSDDIARIKEEAYEETLIAKEEFKLKAKEGNSVSLFFTISIDLVKRIAALFYPNSKRPWAELTVQKILALIDCIIKDLDNLFPNIVNKVVYKGKLKLFVKKKEKKKPLFAPLEKLKQIGINKLLIKAIDFVSIEAIKAYSNEAYDFIIPQQIEEKEKVSE